MECKIAVGVIIGVIFNGTRQFTPLVPKRLDLSSIIFLFFNYHKLCYICKRNIMSTIKRKKNKLLTNINDAHEVIKNDVITFILLLFFIYHELC